MRLNENKGVSIILILLLSVTATAMIGGLLYVININQKVVNERVNQSKAFYTAEAGLNQAMYYLGYTAPDSSTDGSWRTDAYPVSAGSDPTDPQLETFRDGSYTIWVEDAGSNILITSEGIVNNITRTISVEVALTVAVPNTINTVNETWMEI